MARLGPALETSLPIRLRGDRVCQRSVLRRRCSARCKGDGGRSRCRRRPRAALRLMVCDYMGGQMRVRATRSQPADEQVKPSMETCSARAIGNHFDQPGQRAYQASAVEATAGQGGRELFAQPSRSQHRSPVGHKPTATVSGACCSAFAGKGGGTRAPAPRRDHPDWPHVDT